MNNIVVLTKNTFTVMSKTGSVVKAARFKNTELIPGDSD